jgi:hypothetical protein
MSHRRIYQSLNAKRFILKIASAALVALIISASAGCGQELTTSPSSSPPPSATLEPAKALVTITYFYSPTAPPSIHLANEWVLTTVEDGYAGDIARGEIAFVSVNADDPASKPVIDEYHAKMPSLFITTVKDRVQSTVEIKALWLYLDESLQDNAKKVQFVGFLKKEIDKALGIETPIATQTTPPPTSTAAATTVPSTPVISEVGVAVSMGSGAEYFDIAVYAVDGSGKLIPFKGTLAVKLWDRPTFLSQERGALLQEWDNIPVEEDDFIESVGVMLSLPYHDFMPASSSVGWVQVVLTSGTETVISQVTQVQVRRALGC